MTLLSDEEREAIRAGLSTHGEYHLDSDLPVYEAACVLLADGDALRAEEMRRVEQLQRAYDGASKKADDHRVICDSLKEKIADLRAAVIEERRELRGRAEKAESERDALHARLQAQEARHQEAMDAHGDALARVTEEADEARWQEANWEVACLRASDERDALRADWARWLDPPDFEWLRVDLDSVRETNKHHRPHAVVVENMAGEIAHLRGVEEMLVRAEKAETLSEAAARVGAPPESVLAVGPGEETQ